MPHSVASDLGLHCLRSTLLGVVRLQWVNIIKDGGIVRGRRIFEVMFFIELDLENAGSQNQPRIFLSIHCFERCYS